MEAIEILLGILMCKPSLSPLFVGRLGARGVWRGTITTITSVHPTVVKGSIFEVPALCMGFAMARATP
jgi:hypothetical protein